MKGDFGMTGSSGPSGMDVSVIFRACECTRVYILHVRIKKNA